MGVGVEALGGYGGLWLYKYEVGGWYEEVVGL